MKESLRRCEVVGGRVAEVRGGWRGAPGGSDRGAVAAAGRASVRGHAGGLATAAVEPQPGVFHGRRPAGSAAAVPSPQRRVSVAVDAAAAGGVVDGPAGRRWPGPIDGPRLPTGDPCLPGLRVRPAVWLGPRV